MSANWQNILIYAVVLWCCWRLLRRFLPDWSWQTQARLSYFFETRQSLWFKRLGQGLRPAASIPAGCGTHCSKCKTCA